MDLGIRMRGAQLRPTHHVSHTHSDDEDDVAVDFSNAVLYVGALQSILATVLAAVTSVVACVSFPGSVVSAVRTLVLSAIVSVLIVRKPFRLGRVHGLNLVFRALQPCAAIYIASEVCEQLVHTCTRDVSSPSWRRLVFHSASAVMIVSGFLRARRPLAHTDLPFLLTVLSLFVVAMLPPPAVVLSGPLCASPTFASAAERVVRAFVFALLYSVFVYAAAPPVQSSSEVMICVMRASAASIWVLGAHTMLIPLALVQIALVIYTRIFGDEYAINDTELSPLLPPASDAIDVEAAPKQPSSPDPCLDIATESSSGMISPGFGALGARGLVDIGGAAFASTKPTVACGFGSVDVAAVAARLESEG